MVTLNITLGSGQQVILSNISVNGLFLNKKEDGSGYNLNILLSEDSFYKAAYFLTPFTGINLELTENVGTEYKISFDIETISVTNFSEN